MDGGSASPRRVLLGNLEPMAIIGMEQMLTEAGVHVVAEEQAPGAIVVAAERLMPDAVVLALDNGGSRALGEQVRAVAPQAKLIFWARSERLMQVLDPGAVAARTVHEAVPQDLCSELGDYQAIRPEE